MKKKKILKILPCAVLAVAVLIALYPILVNQWNSYRQARIIDNYMKIVAGMSEEEYAEILQAAREYNDTFAQNHDIPEDITDSEWEEYRNILDITGTGIMGYINIPKINVNLPIGHGSTDDVLQIAAGHMEWSSLPIGGESSHCVIGGHTGLPSSVLFSHLNELQKGDIFSITVLEEVSTYEVDRIQVVFPEETGTLRIVEGEDFCTLVTCTPLGVDSHRLLVHGHKI